MSNFMLEYGKSVEDLKEASSMAQITRENGKYGVWLCLDYSNDGHNSYKKITVSEWGTMSLQWYEYQGIARSLAGALTKSGNHNFVIVVVSQ